MIWMLTLEQYCYDQDPTIKKQIKARNQWPKERR